MKAKAKVRPLGHDERLTHWIAVGDNYGWGRSEKSCQMAVAYMHKNGIGGTRKATKYAIYLCTKDTYVNDMGNLVRPIDDPEAVKIKQVGY